MQKSLDLLDRVLSEFDDFETSSTGDADYSQSTATIPAVGSGNADDRTFISDSKGGKEINVGNQGNSPEDESPCGSGQGGHQSEDDGYMSMNGRKAKLMLMSTSTGSGSTTSSNEFTNGDGDATSSTPDTPPPQLPLYDRAAARMRQPNGNDFPPPPEEAERIISTLLPR